MNYITCVTCFTTQDDRVGEMPFWAFALPLLAFLCFPMGAQKSFAFVSSLFTQNSLDKSKCHHRCKGLTTLVFQQLKTNNVLEGQSQWSTCSWACWHANYRFILPDCRCCSLRVKSTFPMAIFLDNNLGQDSYTALPSALNWVLDYYTCTGHLDINN